MNETLKQVLDYASKINSERKSLNEFECLQIAVKIQQNQVFARAFGVQPSEYTLQKTPGFLEAIAMSLGYENTCAIAGAIENGIDRYMDNQFDA